MILGMSISIFTTVHVVLSLVGIATGVAVLLRPCGSPRGSSLALVFLASTIAANVTGLLFLLAAVRFGLGHAFGVVSLAVLVPTVLALYRYRQVGPWRWIFGVGATIALYLNAFIGVTQAFGKIGFLRELPPTAFASPLLLAQLLLLAVCLWLGFHALACHQADGAKPRRTRPRPLRVADRWG